jgi:hypothetical protein
MGTPLVAYLGLPGPPDPWSYTGSPMAATVSMGPLGFEPRTNGLRACRVGSADLGRSDDSSLVRGFRAVDIDPLKVDLGQSRYHRLTTLDLVRTLVDQALNAAA